MALTDELTAIPITVERKVYLPETGAVGTPPVVRWEELRPSVHITKATVDLDHRTYSNGRGIA